MPIYDDEKLQSYVVDFGSGQTLEIKLKPDFDSVPRVRKFIRQTSAAGAAQKHVEKLVERQGKAETVAEIEDAQIEIEAWEQNDQVALMGALIFDTGEGWDRYRTRADEEAGNPVPFTREEIEGLGFYRVTKITEQLIRVMGLGGQEDPKASSTESSSVSQQKVTVEPQSPTGSLN